ncbi:hypothetical protein ACU686_16555 [Yinghuangia aomiensis]
MDINHGCAALPIGLLLGHDKPMAHLTGLAVHRSLGCLSGHARPQGTRAAGAALGWATSAEALL